MYIYIIKNTVSNKCYVGQTIQPVKERVKQHFKKSAKSCPALAAAIRKYGPDNFSVEVIAEADSQDKLNELEVHFISEFNSISPNGYNLEYGGSRGKDSEETKRKRKEAINKPECLAQISSKSKENWARPEYRAKIAEARKQTWKNPQYRKDFMERLTSPESVAKQREIAKRTIVAAAEKLKKPLIGLHRKTGISTWYPSISDAVKCGFSQPEISKCCRYDFTKYSHRNHYWRFANEGDRPGN